MKIEFHPKYISENPIYHEMRDFLSGERERHLPYLIQHETEKGEVKSVQAAWQRRRQTLEVFNHSGLVLDMHTAALNQTVQIDELMAGDTWETILADVTGFDDDVQAFAREISRLKLVDGKVAILVDSPALVAQTEQERLSNGERSYSVVFDATKIAYWSRWIDGYMKGALSEIVLEVDAVDGHRSFRRLFIPAQGVPYQWQTLIAESAGFSSAAKEIECSVIDEGEGAFEYIPVVLWGEGLVQSEIRPTQLVSKSRLNKKSALDNILFYQGFQRVAGFGINPEEQKAMAENTLMLSANENGRFQVIQEGNPDALVNDVKALDRLAFRVGLRQKHMMADDSRDVQSAESKAKDAEALNDCYDRFLDELEGVLTQVFRWHASYESLSEDFSISIDRSYRSEDSDRVMAELQMVSLQAQQLGAMEVQKEVLKRMVTKMPIAPKDGLSEDERRRELMGYIDGLGEARRTFDFGRVIDGGETNNAGT